MSKLITFTKMHGNGNDFVVLDRLTQFFHIDTKLVRRISDRHFGIGCDQVLIIDPPREPTMDFYFRIFNANGAEVSQCGNGARCIGRYVFDQGLTHKTHLKIGSRASILEINLENLKHIIVTLAIPNFAPEAIPIRLTPEGDFYQIPLEANTLKVRAVSVGNPHCIINVPALTAVDVSQIGQQLQQVDIFPELVNVTFVETLARNHLRCRVFERDVGETLACGSAACAAVVCGIRAGELSQEVRVDMPGGPVTVNWAGDNTPVQLMGPVHSVFEGRFLVT